MANSNQPALERFLNRLLHRSVLSAEEREAILALRSHATQYAANRDLVRPGDNVDHATLVVKGLTARFDQMSNGSRQITALHIPGDMCDLHSVPAPVAGWGLTAMTTTTVLKVPHADLLELAIRYPAVALAFWRDTTADGSILAKWVGNVGRRDARARLSHLLCEHGVRMEMAGLGTRTEFEFPITQMQLADALGMTPVHTNRSLQVLRAEGAIRTEYRIIYIPDWERLREIADFDTDYLLVTPSKPKGVPHGVRASNGGVSQLQL